MGICACVYCVGGCVWCVSVCRAMAGKGALKEVFSGHLFYSSQESNGKGQDYSHSSTKKQSQ